MKTGDHIDTLRCIEDAFRNQQEVNRIQVERQAEHLFLVTLMDEKRPTDMRKTASVNKSLRYERRANRGYESLTAYHLPTDTMKFIFYRLASELERT